MTQKKKSLAQLAAWKALNAHSKQTKKLHLRELFTDDPKRGQRMTATAGLFLDYSKNRITEKTLKLLWQLAEQAGLRAKIDAMFRGDKINITENRAVMHMALRAPKDMKILADGKNVVPEVHAVLDKHGRVFQPRSKRRMERSHRQTDQKYCQYRHRRFRSWTGDGVQGH